MSPSVRELAAEDVTAFYLPLRLRIFRDELHWCRDPACRAESLRDEFDAEAVPFGCFAEASFAGALRLVIQDHVSALPSGRFIQNQPSFAGPVGELSRGMVDVNFRQRGFFHHLTKATIRHALSRGVLHLFVSASERDDVKRFYAKFGFTQIGNTFYYSDRQIAVDEPGILLHCDLQKELAEL